MLLLHSRIQTFTYTHSKKTTHHLKKQTPLNIGTPPFYIFTLSPFLLNRYVSALGTRGFARAEIETVLLMKPYLKAVSVALHT